MKWFVLIIRHFATACRNIIIAHSTIPESISNKMKRYSIVSEWQAIVKNTTCKGCNGSSLLKMAIESPISQPVRVRSEKKTVKVSKQCVGDWAQSKNAAFSTY